MSPNDEAIGLALAGDAAALPAPVPWVLKGMGYEHGFFNIELFYDERTDRLTVTEINPRLASQLADLYQKVDGLRVFDMLIELALGRDPALLPRLAPSAGVAASFV